MIYQIIIISVGGLIGLIFFKKTGPNFLKGFLIMLLVILLFSLSNQQYIIDSSFFVFGLLALAFSAYSLYKQNWLSLIISLFTVISVFVDFMIYSYVNEFKWLMIIPILSFVLVLRRWRDYEKELSILTVFAAYESTEFLQLFEY